MDLRFSMRFWFDFWSPGDRCWFHFGSIWPTKMPPGTPRRAPGAIPRVPLSCPGDPPGAFGCFCSSKMGPRIAGGSIFLHFGLIFEGFWLHFASIFQLIFDDLVSPSRRHRALAMRRRSCIPAALHACSPASLQPGPAECAKRLNPPPHAS